MEVYKYMDIGTAKPDQALLSRVPHHLIDVVEPSLQFNAGDFVESALECIKSIRVRRKIPVMAGGTGFYFRNFIFGLPDAPESDTEIRSELYGQMAKEGLDSLYRRLMEIDPEYALKIGSKDRMRIIRALEIHATSGRPVTSFKMPEKPVPGFSFLLIGLFREREDLYRRINARVDHMFESGLVEEVKSLLKRGYTFEDPGLKAIGYREFGQMRRGCQTYPDIREAIKTNTRHYAKRQITYFRAFPGVTWIHAEDGNQVEDTVDRFLQTVPP
jgi:tRNA dimethylallyltransferase